MSMLGRLSVRYATAADIGACDRIARQYPDALGFVRRASLTASAAKRRLHVACVDGVVAGFVEYSTPTRGANVGWNVVYHLAVDKDAAGAGIGRNLLYSVPAPIRLKCPAALGKDNRPNAANDFYTGAGMKLAGTDTTRGGRVLNVYELPVLVIHVQGNNRDIPDIARRVGMAYGTRHIETPRDFPFMLDIHWKNYDWQDYMHKVATWKPVQAMVADYEHPSQRKTMYAQIRDLKAAGVMRVLVCPKFNDAVRHIPTFAVVAVSVPSKYAGFVANDLREYSGRRIHLLGGSPAKQITLMLRLAGVGAAVVSTDGNLHQKAAAYGVMYAGGRWFRPTRNDDRAPDKMARSMVVSGHNIVSEISQAASWAQPPLWQEVNA